MIRLSLLALVLLLGGCAAGGFGGSTPAPIEERKPASKPPQPTPKPAAAKPAPAGNSESAVRVHTIEESTLELQPLSESPQPLPESVPDTQSAAGVETETAASASPAVVALLQQANRHEDSGQLSLAISELERGLRIEPRNALLWHRLALLHAQQGNWQQARQLAQKSSSMAAGDSSLEQKNSELIRRSCAQQPGTDCAQ